MKVQTRGKQDGLKLFPTVKEAYVYALTKPDVWKISFYADNGERVRLVRSEDDPTQFFHEDLVTKVKESLQD
jgi:hypothetical protein